MRASTRSRVLEALQELGGGAPPSRTVGIAVPSSNNPFFANLLYELDRAFQRYDTHLLMSSSESLPEREFRLFEQFRGMGAAGLIFVPSGIGVEPRAKVIAQSGLPCVCLDQSVQGRNVDHLIVDPSAATQTALDYLVGLGHCRIGYLRGPRASAISEARFEAFKTAAAEAACGYDPLLVFEGDFDPESGSRCGAQLDAIEPAKRPSAILAANDMMAMALMQEVQQRGWRLPADLSIIGLDGIELGQWTYPSLTTLAQPVREVASVCASLLLERIQGAEKHAAMKPRTIQLEMELVVRNSTAAPRDPSH